ISSGMTDDKTIIISTHQVRDIDKLLDHVLIMGDNEILLNESTYSIGEKLLFAESDSPVLREKAFFSSPSIQGHYLLLPNEDGQESDLNLELLFNAVLAKPGEMKSLLNI
ncbi:ABC transporter ATP-binding protein, partial [Bacteroides sp. OttesenSCG-928-N06]|nr:ABC transporter ATP-binding protein [Bacteroides sp. OttesenSCG-928-N06]